MPATEYQGSSSPFSSIGRSILSLRRDQVHSTDTHDAVSGELDSFQNEISGLFHDLAGAGAGDLLSLSWTQKLISAFLLSLEGFRVILFTNSPAHVSRPPLDRLLSEFFERSIKALDICNAVSDGIEQVRKLQRHAEIVLLALDPGHGAFREAQFRRAKKALTEISILALDEKETGCPLSSHRHRSFGRSNAGSSREPSHHRRSGGSHSRSLSWSVSRSWSAARQLQAIGSNISAPKGNEIASTGGLAVPIFTMNSLLLFVMWALVAAIPCQDRGLQTHFSTPRNFPWGVSIMSLHERIMEESKKRERKTSSGLLKEIHRFENCARHLMELTDIVHFPLPEEKEREARQWVEELAEVCDSLKEGLDPLGRDLREVFHRIIRIRTEGLDCLGKSSHAE